MTMPMVLTCTDRNGHRLAQAVINGGYSSTKHRRARIYKKWIEQFKDYTGAAPYIFVNQNYSRKGDTYNGNDGDSTDN